MADDEPKRSRARERTQRHLRNLVAGAASGALLGCSSSTDNDPGYGVVDPMPPPARCDGTATLFRATAQWKTSSNVRLLEITLTAPSGREDIKVAGEATNTSATVMQSKTEGDVTTILIDPHAPTASSATVVPVTCPGGPSAIVLNVHADNEHPNTDLLQVELYDQR